MMQQEEKALWKNGLLESEGFFCQASGDHGIVICHPHPLMGGSMHNNVVETIQEVFASEGFSTLRFNFRGVGASTGYYDEGRGEKQDIVSACNYLKSRGVQEVTLAGYSFGAWICCRLCADRPSGGGPIILISPPNKYFEFNWNLHDKSVKLIICGDSDSFCDADFLRETAKHIQAEYVILRSTDHFYAGKETELAGYLRRFIREKKA